MTQKEKDIITKMQDGSRLYKYTGRLPPSIHFEYSDEKIPSRILDSLFKKQLIKVDDAQACETWYTLTDKAKWEIKTTNHE